MKINNYGNIRMNPYQKQIEKQEAAQNVAKKDKLEISSAAQELQKENKISNVRQEKIEALKQKVQSGEYKINPEETARKMVDYFRK